MKNRYQYTIAKINWTKKEKKIVVGQLIRSRKAQVKEHNAYFKII